ncbi:RraA family protein [Ramlibacter tataouinensis]|uniref:Putative 4-hydroxy-4-methyl-2-oxoglutarate aldolase n=1 Tax=Ramlibacter tataouinensis (strain ATCC BAA-407 / DSM 14655 / LMG 21543 / TTB310) TaxID=365046 RepID=F5Y4G9_RAMTT|nr:RraA family protein [Ramlibacter tataouinensis]AEG93816.1 regulator of ribonuclease activity A-like protein [Ramlibacter tataouinensis TTB310]
MVGLQILKRQRRISERLVQAFAGVPVANISDCMSRMTAGGPRLRPMHKSGRLGGAALTVKTRPGDNLMIHKALALAEPGDVIVVDAGGDLTNALIGELMVSYAVSRGIAGFVMNGAIRDLDMIGSGSFPVYAAGVTHRGPYKDGPGEINVPVAIDGMVIHPGDLMVGDADGLLCVPFDQAEAILAAANQKSAAEQKTLQNIAAGRHDTSWVDAALQRIGCDPVPR